MKKRLYQLAMLVMLTVIWVIMSEDGSGVSWLLGLFFAGLAMWVVSHIQHYPDLFQPHYFRPLSLLTYALYLLGQIYLAGIQTVSRVLSGKMQIDLIDIKTELESELAISVLSSSITLTPGTVTVSRDGNKLKILWIDCVTRDPEIAGPLIKKKLEEILLKPEQDRHSKDN